MRSPKLGGTRQRQYYRYYAGYTQGFVEDVLCHLDLPADATVVDPWNGAGTTTAAAVTAGLNGIGYDINPAAVIIGRARLLGSDVLDSLVPIATEVCDRARVDAVEMYDDDLLSTWFGDGTALELRALERAVHRVLVDGASTSGQPIFRPKMPQSSLACVFYVALFRVVRDLVRVYVPSNPSWIKHPEGRRIGVTQSELHARFVQSVKLSSPHSGQLDMMTVAADTQVSVDIASSNNLPLKDGAADAVVSSPPYCTRLDYVVATLPELAVLGLGVDDVRRLRNQMIGTPTISGNADAATPTLWGTKTRTLMERIQTHDSKASSTYYRKYYLQYFAGMWDSISELHRVVRPGCSAVLVVQDSFYKDVHVDLPALIGDMSEAAGWSRWKRLDFKVPRTMAAINPAIRLYRADFGAVESAVVLER